MGEDEVIRSRNTDHPLHIPSQTSVWLSIVIRAEPHVDSLPSHRLLLPFLYLLYTHSSFSNEV